MHLEENVELKSTGRVELEYSTSDIAIIRLGAPSEKVVTLTVERLESLHECIGRLKNERPRALLFTGPTLDMFTAGADISLIQKVEDQSLAEALAKKGQDIFSEIAALPFATIAVISGPCVGGGCELALACSNRIISDHKSSSIGLPEIKLGIIPGFGGTQRLPRLVGLPKALDIILGGKILRPKQALACGLVSEIVPSEKILERAKSIARGDHAARVRSLSWKDRILTHTGIGREFVKKGATQAMLRETKGFYPAPPSALKATLYGLEYGMQAGLAFEAKELGRMIVTPESKALVKIFFLTESAKTIGKAAKKAVDHVQAVVIGAGVMGSGIASVLARNDCTVILKDTTDQAIQRSQTYIRTGLDKLRYLSEQEKSFIFNRIEFTTVNSSTFGNATIAIEAIFEDLEVKKKTLLELAELLPQDAILATNTSSLSVSKIAESIKSPERVVGMHFFNPVEKMPLLEIVRGEKTSDRSVAVIAALASKLGKYPIVVKDVPGFLVNRILTPYLNEASYLLEEYELLDIDRAATAFGMPMGPFRLLDEVGLDVASHVSEIMHKGYGDRMKPVNYAAKLVEKGRRGKKTGAGFYTFTDGEATPSSDLRQTLGLPAAKKARDEREICDRLVFSLVNEAVLCLDEGIAGRASKEAAAQIDLGSVMGFGFPPFRGGVLHFAERFGLHKIVDALHKFESQYGARYKVAPGLIERSRANISFFA